MDANEIALTYKAITIASGTAFAFMGYRLFRVGIFGAAGDLEGAWGETSILLRRAAPGTFFALFGTVIIGATVLVGLDITDPKRPDALVDLFREQALVILERVAERDEQLTPADVEVLKTAIEGDIKPAHIRATRDELGLPPVS